MKKRKQKKKNKIEFEDLLVKRYGKRGTSKREKWERGFQKFMKEVETEQKKERAAKKKQQLVTICDQFREMLKMNERASK